MHLQLPQRVPHGEIRALDQPDDLGFLASRVSHVPPSESEAVTLFLSSRFSRTSSATTCFNRPFSVRRSATSVDVASRVVSPRPAVSCRLPGTPCSSGNTDWGSGLRGDTGRQWSARRAGPQGQSGSSLRPRTAGGSSAGCLERPSLLTLLGSWGPLPCWQSLAYLTASTGPHWFEPAQPATST